MNYECSLIRDIDAIYQDGALSPEGKLAVEEHLARCPSCRAYYESLQNEEEPSPIPQDEETKTAVKFSQRIREYRLLQAGFFFITILCLLTLGLSWFGYPGVSEIRGLVILEHPLAIVGIGLFLFSICFRFQKKSRCLLTGYLGLGAFFLMLGLDFLCMPLGSTTGYQLGPLNFTVFSLASVNIIKSIQMLLPGFYLGFLSFLLVGILFYFYVKRAYR